MKVTGQVQGVGFRPFVWNRAAHLGLTGFVRNESTGVVIEIQGPDDDVRRFVDDFSEHVPPLAVVHRISTEELPCRKDDRFRILDSSVSAGGSTPIAPDIAPCDDCLRELHDSRNRRFRYQFINCTNCGPRFTIVKDIPWDRPQTTMAAFTMCRRCQQEYDDPADRRYHAQPNACPDCGPTVWFLDDPESAAWDAPGESVPVGEAAITAFAGAVRRGQIVAVRGIGGFHLVCDARNARAVAVLRERKRRPARPFAVMMANLAQAARFVEIDDHESRLLGSRERPIVLLKKRTDSQADHLPDVLAPANPCLGILLPYSPLHELLIESVSPLLMTSGNLSDEPIVRTGNEARARLTGLADAFLLHNRDIHVVCDDSVVRSVDDTTLPIRRSRGYAPMPLRLRDGGPGVLAAGGELKTTLCVTKNDYAWLSQHIGDTENPETLAALHRAADHYLKLFRIDLQAVAADLHPNYLSSQWAERFAAERRVPLIRVQHHFAHAASLMAEHRHPGPLIACCFDGTGYGTDGTIWGGEFLLTDGTAFERAAFLRPFPLPGGDVCVRRPWRTALALLHASGCSWDDRLPCAACAPDAHRRLLRQQLERSLNCPLTSSAGRLFDAVASLIGLRHEVSYEAQAAMELEAAAHDAVDSETSGSWQFGLTGSEPIEIDCRTLLMLLAEDVLRGTEPRRLAARFHLAVADMIWNVCVRLRERSGWKTVGLTGGVFQNVLLLRLVQQRLRRSGFTVLTHSVVPPNDGGLALGQAVIARRQVVSGD